MKLQLIQFLTLLIPINSIHSILDFGAVPHEDTLSAQFTNSKAILATVLKANSTVNGQRAVRIPKGTFYSMPIRMQNIYNVTFVIEGKLSASKNILKWPKQPAPDSKYYQDFISCHNCLLIEIGGGGKIDGRGYHWWVVCILNQKKYLQDQAHRPHLIRLFQNQYIHIHDITLKNSPQFHLKMDQCYDAQLHHISILVNTTAQINLIKKLSLEGVVPLFPLNTDGIDPYGARMHIYQINVQNFDDVVVPKPSHQGHWLGNCTEDILVQNATVVLGVGMTIGSVPPNKGCNCIRNVTFRNVYMSRPLKGIYVKTNPGEVGTGLVQNIYYKNVTMDRPVWWAIYIGPQQMKEPDKSGPGCMLYPFDKHGTCTTQPRVTLRNITLEDVTIHNSLLYPVTIRCNTTNPCTGINFINVHTDKWKIGQKQKGYVCEFASGKGFNNTPKIQCLNQLQMQSTNNNLKVNKVQQKRATFGKWENLSMKEFQILISQLEAAVKQFQYHEEDDEFDYDFDPALHFGTEQLIS